MKAFFSYIESLCKANSMASSKSFTLLLTAATGCLGVICISIGLLVEWFTAGYIRTSLSEMSMYIASLGVFVGSGAITKISGEKRERKERAEVPPAAPSTGHKD
jgi:hypothetical protein|nr:MAG TPA: hypothetical protein [Caudoviricetes sp.]